MRAEPPSGLADRLRRTARSLQQRFPGDRTILMHGDLTPNNVLFHDGRAELIDWDLATPVDFAGYDILNLIRYDQCGPQPDPDYWPGVVDGCSRGHVDPETARWIERAAGPADPVAAMAAFWLLRMARGVGFGDAWIERNAIPSLERAEAWLA
ncbi:MAG: hypothetical protein DHS20C21_17000 [Gemmatimonadota bacterium]|nr:MAG: hypothetical protein DHS20C21_17000 [Gemmatimonadota bacterium]